MIGSALDGSRVTCPRCGRSWAAADLDRETRWLCAACDVAVAGPQRTSFDTLRGLRVGDRFLYARRPRQGATEGTARGRVGRYTLRSELGRGGMGVVYRAHDPELARDVALKLLIGGVHSSHADVERFLREARSAASLDHPHLVRVHDIGWTEGRAYFTMDLVDGPTLQDLLDERGRLPVVEAARIGAAIARALHAAHQRGLVHRDVKPGNILLREDGTPLLTDFGLAAEQGDSTRLTRTGQVLGTPAYMAPEQTVGRDRVGPLTDQYALGAVLYETLSGVAPYPGESAIEVLYALVEKPPVPLRERAPDLPAELALVVETAMAREPAHRYPTSLLLAEDLERFVRGEPVWVRPPSLTQRLRARLRRHQRPVGLALTGIVAAVAAGTAVSTWSSWRGMRRSEAWQERAAVALHALEDRVATLPDPTRADVACRELEDFASLPENLGTRAASQALLTAAGLHAEAGRSAEAARTYAAAYAASAGVVEQDRALRGLAATFHDQWAWEPLAVVSDHLVGRDAALRADPRVARWRAEALLGLRDLPGAAERLQGVAGTGATGALLRALSRGQPAPHLDGRSGVADLDLDGGDDWVVAGDDGAIRVIRLVEGLPTTRRWKPPPGRGGTDLEVFPVAGDRPTLLVRWTADSEPPQAAIWRPDETTGQLVELTSWPESRVLAALSADVDHDGQREIWVGVGPYARRVLRVSEDGRGGWTRSSPLPELDATGSDIATLAVADLDGDGAGELVVGAGAWTAYDLRAYRDQDGVPTRIARTKLGFVSSVRRIQGTGGAPDRLLVAKSDEYPSEVMFPPDRPFGEPPGAQLLALDGSELRALRTWPSPAPRERRIPSAVDGAWLGDLDGDGAQELVMGVSDARLGEYLVIWPGAGDAEPVVIGGARPRWVGQLDEDPALELIVDLVGGRRTAWVLGAGDEVLPALPRATTPPVPPDATSLDAASVRVWSRAEDLVAMGLPAAALDPLERLAAATEGPAAARILARAARLSEAIGDDRSAARLFEEAGARGDPSSLDAAARTHLAGHRPDAALATWSRLADDPATPRELADRARDEVARLRPQVERTRSLRVVPEPDPPLAALLDPIAARVQPDGTLRLQVIADDGPTLRMPFRWSGERLGLEVELELERVEWGAGLAIRLVGPASTVGVGIRGWGGGGLLEHEVYCELPGGGQAGRRMPVDGPGKTSSLVLALDLSTTSGDARCAITEDGAPLLRQNLHLERGADPGEWELRVEASGHAGVLEPMLATARVTALRLDGSRLEPIDGPDPEGARLRTLARGEPLPTARPGVETVWNAQRLAEAGRLEPAQRSLGTPPDPDDPGEVARELVHALRASPAAFGPVLRAATGDAYWSWFLRAFGPALHAHPDDRIRQALTTGTAGLELAGRGSDGAPRQVVAELLAARGRAWAGLSEPDAARRDLRLAAELGAIALAEAPPGVQADATRRALAEVHLDLAGIAAAAGAPVDARAEVDAALAVSPMPEITADLVRVRPELAELLADPSFERHLP